MKTLTVPNTYDQQISNHTAGGTVFSGQMRCDWLYASGSEKDPAQRSILGSIYTLGDVSHMQQIANQIMVQQANPSGGSGNPAPNGGYAMKFFVTRAKMVQDLHNTNNFPIMVRAYKCMPRQAIPNNPGIGLGNYPMDAIGRGYANSGLYPGFPDGTNTAILDWNKTLYQSTFFCEWFKILRVKKFHLKAGGHAYFRASQRPYQVHPDHDIGVDATHNYINTSGLVVSYRHNEQFWLYQYACPLAMSGVTDGVAHRPIQAANTSLMLTTTFRYQYKFIDDNVPNHLATQILGLGAPPASGYVDVVDRVPYVVNSTITPSPATTFTIVQAGSQTVSLA